jgi:Raf kinase inhibitor-like YbhB/YbcL family protein
MKSHLVVALVLAACGSNSAKSVDAASGDTGGGPPATMSLTSTAFAEGGAIPTANTCKGANTSPALAWTGAPSGTQSFAVVLTDLSRSLIHWVIYDIPPSTTSLPAGIENAFAPSNVPGAHQTVSLHAPTIGFYGPCPPQPPAHTYQFAVYALDVVKLPGLSGQSTPPEGVAEIQTHRLDSGTLTGMFGS